ncbi:unnamed protein product [Effrenium voratum]|nr:unnamed protein product [Effrenium voratum]|mmetsp:Transcript_125368/g.297623  ORF Transcript_125368/g.297623 Transcript_125368/m.297623 type:complete len:527 (+) Transcript_125368:168-1748(+)
MLRCANPLCDFLQHSTDHEMGGYCCKICSLWHRKPRRTHRHGGRCEHVMAPKYLPRAEPTEPAPMPEAKRGAKKRREAEAAEAAQEPSLEAEETPEERPRKVARPSSKWPEEGWTCGGGNWDSWDNNWGWDSWCPSRAPVADWETMQAPVPGPMPEAPQGPLPVGPVDHRNRNSQKRARHEEDWSFAGAEEGAWNNFWDWCPWVFFPDWETQDDYSANWHDLPDDYASSETWDTAPTPAKVVPELRELQAKYDLAEEVVLALQQDNVRSLAHVEKEDLDQFCRSYRFRVGDKADLRRAWLAAREDLRGEGSEGSPSEDAGEPCPEPVVDEVSVAEISLDELQALGSKVHLHVANMTLHVHAPLSDEQFTLPMLTNEPLSLAPPLVPKEPDTPPPKHMMDRLRRFNVRYLRFSQRKISRVFKDGTPLEDLINGLREGNVSLEAPFLQLSVVQRPDSWGRMIFVCSDNRRLYCLKMYQAHLGGEPLIITAKYTSWVHFKAARTNEMHFDTTTDGRTVKLRGEGSLPDI